MKLLITGARGFLGSSFGQYAAAAGHQVLGISRSSQALPDWPGEHVQADTVHTDLALLFRTWRPDLILHAAGSASSSGSVGNPLDDLRANVLTLANVLDAIRRASISPVFIFPSSAAVYGQPTAFPTPEFAAAAPVSPYGFHKAACELLVREAAQSMGLRVIVCRIFSVYGPRQRRKLIWDIYRQLRTDAPVMELRGTGNEARDFLHIDDLCTAFLALAQHPAHGCAIVNIGSGIETAVTQLVEEMKRIAGSDKVMMCAGHTMPGSAAQSQAALEHLEKLVPLWRPRSLRLGLEQTMGAWDLAEKASVV